MLEAFSVAKKSLPTNMAGALRCVKMVRQGKACSMADLKAALMLLDDARKTGMSTIRLLKERSSFLERMLNR